jgi:uncharacterized protein YbjT (DUF2867 family)
VHLGARKHHVLALTRAPSRQNLPAGCEAVIGDALDAATFAHAVPGSRHVRALVGVPHPSPAKAAEFRNIDLVSARAAIETAQQSRIQHFVYISVAQPAPVMRAYIEVRAEVEAQLRASGINATIVRPWYVLGPGHWWPYLLLPGYWLAERISATRTAALRLGLVTVEQMVRTLIAAVEMPAIGVRILGVPEIRAARV